MTPSSKSPSIAASHPAPLPRRPLLALCALAAAAAVWHAMPSFAAEAGVLVPLPADDVAESAATETAVFAGGSFWGVQGVFQHVRGVRPITRIS